MKQYMLVMEQVADGCDYTIGCGIDYELFEAEDIHAARKFAEEHWFGSEFIEEEEWMLQYEDERELHKMFLVEVIEECPIKQWLDYAQRKRRAIEESETEKKERELLATLKAKYGE